MTLSKRSDPVLCGKCGGEMSWMAYRPYPLVTYVLFASSFLLFVIFNDKVQAHRPWLWAWSLVQISLGVLLVYQRLQARRRVLRCIRCIEDLR